jgi:3-methyladenine DNA glycosylase AlkD
VTYEEVIKILKKNANPKNVMGMARFGINPNKTLGLSIPFLRKLAKGIKKSAPETHLLSQKLWSSGYHEARILASMIDEPKRVTESQMDSWVKDFDSWDVCDQVCGLFAKTPYAFKKAIAWTKNQKEFTRRAGFALMATLAWHDKISPDEAFTKFFTYIKKYSTDERNYVKKAVNWALRQIGKTRPGLKKEAIKTAKEILKTDSSTARWIATDAIRELTHKRFVL